MCNRLGVVVVPRDLSSCGLPRLGQRGHFSLSVAERAFTPFPRSATQGASMASIIVAFVIGLFIGGALGYFTAALMAAGHSADEYMRALRVE